MFNKNYLGKVYKLSSQGNFNAVTAFFKILAIFHGWWDIPIFQL